MCETQTAREGVWYHEHVHFREMKAPVSGDGEMMQSRESTNPPLSVSQHPQLQNIDSEHSIWRSRSISYWSRGWSEGERERERPHGVWCLQQLVLLKHPCPTFTQPIHPNPEFHLQGRSRACPNAREIVIAEPVADSCFCSQSSPEQSVKAGKQRAQPPALQHPTIPPQSPRPPKHRKSSSADLFPSSVVPRDSSWIHLWNPLNSSSSAINLKSTRASSRATSSTQRPTIRKSKSLPLRSADQPVSGPSSLLVETSNEASASTPSPIAAPPSPRIPAPAAYRPPDMPIDSAAPSPPDKDPERDGPKALAEIPWGPAHPCFPHPNPHVPLSSPLQSTTRIIRIKRDWMIVGDLAPTFSNIYPEILEPWVSDADFRDLIQNVNERLIKAFHPGGWRAWLDAALGLLTGWIWEDLGFSAIKLGLKDTEQWIEKWNGREGKMGGETDIDSAKVVPLRRTAYLSVSSYVVTPRQEARADSRRNFSSTFRFRIHRLEFLRLLARKRPHGKIRDQRAQKNEIEGLIYLMHGVSTHKVRTLARSREFLRRFSTSSCLSLSDRVADFDL